MVNTGLICISVIAQIGQQSIDVQQAFKQFGFDENELNEKELTRVAKACGFKVKIKQSPVKAFISKYPLPAISLLKDGSYRVILKKIDNDRILVFDPKTKETKPIPLNEFGTEHNDIFLVMKHSKVSSSIRFGFSWFYREIIKYKSILAEVLLGSFIVQLFGLVTPLFTQVILDKVIVHNSISTLKVLAVAFLGITLFEFLMNLARNYIFIHTAKKLDAKLGSKLFKHLFSLPYVYFESRKVGNIIARVRELDTIREFITNKTVSVVIDVFFSFVFVIVMFLYSVKLTFIVLGFVGAISLIYAFITPLLRKRLKNKFEMGAKSNAYLVESVTGIQTVKSLALEGSMQKKWEEHLCDYVFSSFKLASMMNFSSTLSQSVQKLMTISILYMGVGLVIKGNLTVGQLIAFQMFAGQFSGPVLRLVSLWNELQQTLISINMLGDILNQPAENNQNKNVALPKLSGQITFDKIRFRYNADSPYVIQDLTLNIKPGLNVGIVGRSGSGKSTLAKLIQRIYTCNEGSILIDGVDIRYLDSRWLRNNLGVVLQDNYLFSGTIHENIVLSKPTANFDEVLHASRLSGAHDFISQLPEGYDTMVGERGASLSGGQKQRVAIARALLNSPSIIIFDEATSALDYESERVIQNNMKQITEGRTSIVIAHRLSTIKDCDVILVMDKGQIVEYGNHRTLIEKKGAYHHLSTLQGVN